MTEADNGTQIDQLWVRAAGHLRSAESLYSKANEEFQGHPKFEQLVFNGPYSASCYLLIGYAFELAFKAAFLIYGGPREALSSKLKHNLQTTLTASEELGFKPPIENLHWTIEQLTPVHLNHHFRYGGEPKVDLPSLELSIQVCRALVEAVMYQGKKAGHLKRGH